MFSFVPNCLLALLVDPTGYWAPTVVPRDASDRIEEWTCSTPRRQSLISSNSSSFLDLSLDSILDTPQCQSIQPCRVLEADDTLADRPAHMDDELDLFKPQDPPRSASRYSLRSPVLKRNFSASTVSSMLKTKELKKSPSVVLRPAWKM